MTERLEVIVLTGFLGSGKTTLLASLLAHPSLSDTAVIVNELGEIPVDHHLIRAVDENTVVLASGCVCCSLRTDLAAELRHIVDRSDAGEIDVRRVVIETTGLADPAPIANTILSDPLLRHRCSLAAVITTVDGMQRVEEASREAEWSWQISAADRICITKTDIAPTAHVDALAAAVGDLNPLASIIRAPIQPDAVPAILRSASREPSELPEHAHPHGAGEVSSFSFVTDRPLDWIAFGIWLTMLLQAHGADLLRVKGLLDVGTHGLVSLNGVRHVFHPPEHLERRAADDHRTRIVFIGRRLDPAAIELSLMAFQAAVSSAGSLERSTTALDVASPSELGAGNT